MTPVYPGTNLLRRMNAVKSGMEVGRNFITGAVGKIEEQEAHLRGATGRRDSVGGHDPPGRTTTLLANMSDMTYVGKKTKQTPKYVIDTSRRRLMMFERALKGDD